MSSALRTRDCSPFAKHATRSSIRITRPQAPLPEYKLSFARTCSLRLRRKLFFPDELSVRQTSHRLSRGSALNMLTEKRSSCACIQLSLLWSCCFLPPSRRNSQCKLLHRRLVKSKSKPRQPCPSATPLSRLTSASTILSAASPSKKKSSNSSTVHLQFRASTFPHTTGGTKASTASRVPDSPPSFRRP